MTLASDLRVLYHLVLKPVRGKDHAARMESFYAGQAEAYDGFRNRLLQGRRELYSRFRARHACQDGLWVDMGGGTGANQELLGPRIADARKVYIVDLSPSLLKVARQRIARHGWSNVETVQADATTFRPAEGPVDVVTFSYSLTMIPDWFAAIENAYAILKPGGLRGGGRFPRFAQASGGRPGGSSPGSRGRSGPSGSPPTTCSYRPITSRSCGGTSSRSRMPSGVPRFPICRCCACRIIRSWDGNRQLRPHPVRSCPPRTADRSER